MKTVTYLILLTITVLSFYSCDDSLGLDDNVIKDPIDPSKDTITYDNFIMYHNIGDMCMYSVYRINENGDIEMGEYIVAHWAVVSDTLVWQGRMCYYINLPVNNGPWCYIYNYSENSKIYTNPGMALNRKSWSPDPHKLRFPALENVWVLRADFNKKSWIGLDSTHCEGDLNEYLSFKGKRFIWGEKLDITEVFITNKRHRCLEILEHINFKGILNRSKLKLTDTLIDYTYTVHSFLSDDKNGTIMEIEKLPPYNFGLGDVPFTGFRTEMSYK